LLGMLCRLLTRLCLWTLLLGMLCRLLTRLCLWTLLLCGPRTLLWLTLLFFLLVLRVRGDNCTVKQNHGSGAHSSKEFHSDHLQLRSLLGPHAEDQSACAILHLFLDFLNNVICRG
jgi:hypothetical protein